jgi:hypothetical protein
MLFLSNFSESSLIPSIEISVHPFKVFISKMRPSSLSDGYH